MNTLPKLPIWM